MSKSSCKKYALLFLIGFLSLSTFVAVVTLTSRDKTRNFGSSADSFQEKRLKKECCQKVNRTGLDSLNTYGSGFINFGDFGDNIKYNYKNLYVISLMPTDIYYYKGRCLRWYGLNYTPNTLGKNNKEKKWRGLNKQIVRLVYGPPPTHDVTQLDTEEKLVQALGVTYVSPLKGNMNWLLNQSYIDDLVAFFEKLPPNARLYFHCIHGRGRTTTFLAFYDIFKNGKNVSLEDITNRHHCLGRENLLDTVVWKAGNWTEEALKTRRDLVTNFYNYMTSGTGYPHKTWVQWTKEKGIRISPLKIHR